MNPSHLPFGGLVALFAFVAAIVAGVFWFNDNSAAQASSGGTVEVQAIITNKTTVHRPVSATTNGNTVRRMENSYVVTLAFLDGRKPPLELDQSVNISFFRDVAINTPVRVTLDPDNAEILDLVPGTLRDPLRFVSTGLLGLLFLALGLGAAVWRKRSFESPQG